MLEERPTRVLVAEDDYLVGEMVRGMLQEMGYEVVGEASDGAEAVRLARSLRPDVVVMDVRMPDVDGIEAAQRLHDCCPLPVVILTAYETPELVAAASRAGVEAYLVKPPGARELERAITIAMARFDDMMELRRLNAELETRNDELRAFAHTVAHDLKNPLSLIIGFAEMLGEGQAAQPPAEVGRQLLTIAHNARKMDTIIDELLLLAEVRETEVALQPLDMGAVVAEACARLRPTIDERAAEVILPPHWPHALGHAPWVEAVWVNYLSNALKYGGEPPRVELGWDDEIADSSVRFWVHDNGPGIPPEDQARLFTPFTRLGQVRARGHGLGLSIVRRIVKKLGGQVGVESRAGGGSTFSFTLPAAPAAEKAQA